MFRFRLCLKVLKNTLFIAFWKLVTVLFSVIVCELTQTPTPYPKIYYTGLAKNILSLFWMIIEIIFFMFTEFVYFLLPVLLCFLFLHCYLFYPYSMLIGFILSVLNNNFLIIRFLCCFPWLFLFSLLICQNFKKYILFSWI